MIDKKHLNFDDSGLRFCEREVLGYYSRKPAISDLFHDKSPM